jgi:Ser/Thr protein kinase RdoA (MazF antagonist)
LPLIVVIADARRMVSTVGPPGEGVRTPYSALPPVVHDWVDELLGSPVVSAGTRAGGFSPGVAAVVACADGRTAFVKAVSGDANPVSPEMHRREALAAAALPASVPAPRLLGVYDDGTWVALAFEAVAGEQPRLPWSAGDLDRVLRMLARLTDDLTPSPWRQAPELAERMGRAFSGWRRLAAGGVPAGLDDWSRRHLDALAELEAGWEAAAAGTTLLHHDVRADNLLLDGERVWLVDWPAASVGAAWIDVALFAPSVAMQGGPPPEELLGRSAAARTADPAAITAYVAAIAGYLTRQSLLPEPAGLPTVRAFQAAQAEITRAWLAERTGWR